MAVVSEELFVCDQNNNTLQVFSVAGEHRRSITGAWKKPRQLCAAADRLYLVEDRDDSVQDTRGGRIWVLSTQGVTLQTYTFEEGQHITEMCCFDGKLLVSVTWALHQDAVIAFRGL